MTLRALVERLFTAYCLVLFAILALIALTVNLFVPTLRARRWVAGTLSRAFFRLAGIPLKVEGLERLPKGPCVVVANHASYIDGIVAAAALPPDFAFVIKKEMVRVPLASLLLRRLGSAFVERFDRHKGGADTRRVWKLAARGAVARVLSGRHLRYQQASAPIPRRCVRDRRRSNMPMVAAAIHGTREVLPSGGIMVYRHALRFEILQVLDPEDARERSRQLIAEAVGEPLAP